MKHILLALLLFVHVGVCAQQITELPAFMERALDKYEDDYRVHLFLQSTPGHLADLEKEGRLQILGVVSEYQLVAISIGELKGLAQSGALTYMDALWAKGQPLNDQMLINNNVLPVHQGVGPIGRSLKGEGVIMGIIDTGVELSHPDFLDENEETRVIELWDMVFEFDEEHLSEFGFGSVWDKDQIDAGEAINHRDQVQWFGHGSTVTGSACADGSAIGNFGGVAPLTDMAIISFDFDRPDFLPLMVLSAQYLIDIADAEEKPIVINASLGTYYGSHDGLDPTSLYIDSLLDAAPGRLMVAAAGNSGSLAPYHLRTRADGETGFTWFEAENGLGDGGAGMFFEAWADSSDISQVVFSLSADSLSADTLLSKAIGSAFSVQDIIGQNVIDSLMADDGTWIANVQYWAQYRGEQVQLQAYVGELSDASHRFRFSTTGPQHFDIWSTSTFGTSDILSSGLPSEEDYSELAAYVSPDRQQHMVSSFTCSDHVVTVANYVNRSQYTDYNGNLVNTGADVGNLDPSSSYGPSRIGLQKPDIAASGSVAISAGDFDILTTLISNEPFKVAQGGLHHRNGGTSMASPVVAGVAALFLEQCPLSTWQDFRSAIHSTGQTDLFTDEVPSTSWGHGKLNAYAAISSSSLIVEVSVEEGVLSASAGEEYQWFVDDVLIPGANSPTIDPADNGVYSVQVTDERGCAAISEGVAFTTVDENTINSEISVRQLDHLLSISGLQSGDRIDMYDALGRSVHVSHSDGASVEISSSTMSAGLMHIVVTRNGNYYTEKVLVE